MAHIEAVALYAAQPDFGFVGLLERLNRRLTHLGLSFAVGALTGEDVAVFNGTAMHLVVTIRDTPLPGKDVAGALAAPIARMKNLDYAGTVADHGWQVRIHVGEGQHGGGEAPAAFLATPARRCEVLHNALLCLIDMDRPRAVHWRQSDMIFLPEEIERTDASRFPAPLAMRPTPLRADDTGAGTGAETGLRADGSECFAGMPIVIAPGPMPLAVSISVAEYLLQRYVAEPAALRDRAVIAFSEDMQLAIRHTGRDGAAQDAMILVRFEPTQQTEPDAEPDDLPDTDDLLAAVRRRQRSEQLRTYALCATLGLMMPVPAAALFVWNIMRGANLTVTAAAFALALAFITGVEVIEILPALDVAGLSADYILSF